VSRQKGKIIKWNDDKGFGFILPENSKTNIFVHIKSFTDRNVRPTENQSVTYTVQNNDNGKNSAINVSRSTDNPIRSRTNNSSSIKNIIPKHKRRNTNNILLEQKSTHDIPIFYILIILGFMVFLFHFSIREEKLPPLVIIVYIVMGILTYYIYSEDKSQAIDSERRTSEQSLLTLSFFGGWIGALIAQHKFHHKVKKISFQISFWTTVFFNILLLSSAFQIIHF
jgi:uncharacterized membrane protein YsdA (DUF1294 family)/cold shock CspA family protein